MMAKPMKTLELHFPMIQFLINRGMEFLFQYSTWYPLTSERKPKWALRLFSYQMTAIFYRRFRTKKLTNAVELEIG